MRTGATLLLPLRERPISPLTLYRASLQPARFTPCNRLSRTCIVWCGEIAGSRPPALVMKDKAVLIPEIVEPDEQIPRDLLALRRFAWLLDAAFEIPSTKTRAGINSVVGLIPGIGDAIGATLSLWILGSALRHRIPLPQFFRMVSNVLIALVVGSIPVLGDAFDIFWKENMSNVEMLIRNRNRQRQPRGLRELFLGIAVLVAMLLLIILFAVVSLIVIVVLLLRYLF
jgi:hypothetical protein